MGKSILGSKTVWFNVITFVLIVLSLPEFKSVIPVDHVQSIGLIASILNVVIRIFFTSESIISVLPQGNTPTGGASAE